MSLMRMGKTDENVRFMDDVDFTLSLDSRSSSVEQSSDIEVSVKPIVFRASYRDINLITTIANRAVELYTRSIYYSETENPATLKQRTIASSKYPLTTSHQAPKGTNSQEPPVGRARVLVAKEQVRNTTYLCDMFSV